MKIGIYGGSFNPVHNAHIKISQWILQELELDKMIFVLSSISPFKANENDLEKTSHRLNMLRLALESHPKSVIGEYECTSEKVTYSIDTLKTIAKEYSLTKDEMFFIVGEDNFRLFDKWKSPEAICKLATVVVAGREQSGHDSSIEELSKKFGGKFLKTPMINISSSEIRQKISRGISVKESLPEQVEQYISENKLYRGENG